MMFKNLQLYRLPVGFAIASAELERGVFRSCDTFDRTSAGFVPPLDGGDELVRRVGDHLLICLQTEAKVMPTAPVNQEVKKRTAAFELEQGYRLGRIMRQSIKDNVTVELLAKALTAIRKTYAWIDLGRGYLCINASSPARAEEVIEKLRNTLDHFPLSLLRTERSPASVMASWLAEGEASAGFTIDQECELRSVTDDKAVVRYVRHTLDNAEIKAHLKAMKMPVRLALTFDERVSFVLTEKLEIKKIEYLDVLQHQFDAAREDGGNAADIFDTEFFLATGELGRLVESLIAALGGELRGS